MHKVSCHIALSSCLTPLPAGSFFTESLVINGDTDHRDPRSPCYYLQKFIHRIPPFSTHTHAHRHRIEQLLQVSDAGSALLVPVARTVISGPRGSVKGCVFECVCVWTWKGKVVYWAETAQSLQVGLWKIVSSQQNVPWLCKWQCVCVCVCQCLSVSTSFQPPALPNLS